MDRTSSELGRAIGWAILFKIADIYFMRQREKCGWLMMPWLFCMQMLLVHQMFCQVVRQNYILETEYGSDKDCPIIHYYGRNQEFQFTNSIYTGPAGRCPNTNPSFPYVVDRFPSWIGACTYVRTAARKEEDAHGHVSQRRRPHYYWWHHG